MSRISRAEAASLLSRGLKRCPDCGATKPLDEFPRDRSAKSGRGGYCLLCNGDRVRAHAEVRRRQLGEEAWKKKQREKLARHRQRTNNTYQRRYSRAWRAAAQALIARHPDEFEALFTTERALVEEAS